LPNGLCSDSFDVFAHCGTQFRHHSCKFGLVRRDFCPDVKVVVVDYLQLVRAEARDIRERVGKVADALRQLAKADTA
jgi:hypothetical protein